MRTHFPNLKVLLHFQASSLPCNSGTSGCVEGRHTGTDKLRRQRRLH